MPSRPHVLLVDDHAEVRAVLVHVLTHIFPEATIAQAWHGAEALNIASQHPPDLIITDYQMPIMDGLELVGTLRAQGETLPILLLSSDPDIAQVALAQGATAFLPKPFSLPALRNLLSTLLSQGEASHAVGE